MARTRPVARCVRARNLTRSMRGFPSSRGPIPPEWVGRGWRPAPGSKKPGAHGVPQGNQSDTRPQRPGPLRDVMEPCRSFLRGTTSGRPRFPLAAGVPDIGAAPPGGASRLRRVQCGRRRGRAPRRAASAERRGRPPREPPPAAALAGRRASEGRRGARSRRPDELTAEADLF